MRAKRLCYLLDSVKSQGRKEDVVDVGEEMVVPLPRLGEDLVLSEQRS